MLTTTAIVLDSPIQNEKSAPSHSKTSEYPTNPPSNPKFKWWRSIIEAPLRRFHGYQAKKKKEAPQDRAARLTAHATIAIAAFTCVAALVGSLQWCALRSTDEAIHAQLDQMRIEQRSWLALTVVPTHMEVERNRVGGPYITLGVTVKNVGKTPASDVTVRTITHVPAASEGGFLEMINKRCDRFPMTGFAPLVVPGDTYTQNMIVAFTEIQIKSAWSLIGQKNRKAFNVLPLVCVLYKIASDETIHLMGAVTEIEKLTEERPATFDVLGKYGD